MTDVYTELLQENSELEAKILRLEQENKVLRKTKSKLLADLHEANDICNAWEKEVNKLGC